MTKIYVLDFSWRNTRHLLLSIVIFKVGPSMQMLYCSMPPYAQIHNLIFSHFSKMAHHCVHQAFIKVTRLAMIHLVTYDNLIIIFEWSLLSLSSIFCSKLLATLPTHCRDRRGITLCNSMF